MTKSERIPRIRAVVLPHPSPDRTVVRPEVWEGLMVEAVERLGAKTAAIFSATTAYEIMELWLRNGLTSATVRQYARALRETAFLQEGDGGAAPVHISDEIESQVLPGVLTTLAAVFDYLAALSPQDGQIRFEAEVSE